MNEGGSEYSLEFQQTPDLTQGELTLAPDANGGTEVEFASTQATTFSPALSGGGAASYNSNGSPTQVFASLGVVDPSSATLTSATVDIMSGLRTGDALEFVNQNGITGAYDAATGALTLSGTASLADYQAALQSVTFGSSASDPTNSGADLLRTVAVTAESGALTSNVVTSGIVVNDAPIPSLKTLVSFTAGSYNAPTGNLIADAAGDLIGITHSGDVFEIKKSGAGFASTPTSLASFTGNLAGVQLQSPLITDAQGDLFGVMANGGADGDGAVFEIPYVDGAYASAPQVLASFDGSDGQAPSAGLTLDAAGDLFGTTNGGGTSSNGTVFEIAKTSNGYASTPTTLLNLSSADGYDVYSAELLVDSAGNLIGTTEQGGPNNDGDVFEIAKTSQGYASAPTILATVGSQAGLIANAAGDLFGETNDDAIIEIAKTSAGYASAPTTLAYLTESGFNPEGGLIEDLNGDLFGATQSGGADGEGTLFEIRDSNGDYDSTPVTLATFEGEYPDPSGLIADAEGNLFGTTINSEQNVGTVFELTGAGYQTTLEAGPTLSDLGASANYVIGGSPVVVDAGLTVKDSGAATLTGATVAIASQFLAGDQLNFVNQNGISGFYDASTGVLTLAGEASAADYQTALESITFDSASANTYASGPSATRTIDWTLSAGALASNTLSSTIDLTPGVKLHPGGTFTNSGRIDGVGYGVEIYGGVGTVTNSTGGSISATEGVAVDLEAGGTVTNQSGATIGGSGFFYYYGFPPSSVTIEGGVGTVTNAGAITNSLSLQSGGAVTNASSGVIDGGVSIGGGNGSVTNNGTLESYVKLSGGEETVTNAGSITGGVSVASGSATIGNDAKSAISGGVSVSGGSGAVTNSGTISAANADSIRLAGGGSVTNDSGGTIGSSTANASAIYILGGAGTVTNAGAIEDGVWLQTSGTVTNQTGGLITGDNASGGYGVGLHAGGSATNYGKITGLNVGLELDGGGTATNEANATISGSDAGVLLGFPVAYPQGDSNTGGGSLTNDAGATISGDIGIGSGGSAATVNNAGAIAGTTNGTLASHGLTFTLGDGVDLAAGGTVTNQTTGTITGAADGVYSTGGAGAVSNAGGISGNDGIVLNDGGTVGNQTGGNMRRRRRRRFHHRRRRGRQRGRDQGNNGLDRVRRRGREHLDLANGLDFDRGRRRQRSERRDQRARPARRGRGQQRLRQFQHAERRGERRLGAGRQRDDRRDDGHFGHADCRRRHDDLAHACGRWRGG